MIIGIAIPSFIALIGCLVSFGYINNVQKRQGYEQIANGIRNHVLEVRRKEKIFLNFKNTKHLDNLHNTISSLNRSTNDVSPSIVKET